MTDTKELRRLAQAATPGPWQFWHGWVATNIDSDGGTVIAERPTPSGGKYQARVDGNFRFIAAANPATISELLNRIEAAESDAVEQARLNGMGASREAALMAKLEAAEKDRDALRAKIEAMEKQEPVAWCIGNEICAREDWACVISHDSFVGKGRAIPDSWVPLLYAAPVSAKREWVDLTDDEIDLIEQQVYCRTTQKGRPLGVYAVELVRAVIAAFKEKNK